MPTTNIQVRVDAGLKAKADKLFSDMGLDMPTAIRIFLKQALQKNGLPFAVERDPFYSEENMARLAEVADDLDQGKNCAEHELLADR